MNNLWLALKVWHYCRQIADMQHRCSCGYCEWDKVEMVLRMGPSYV